MSDLPSLVKRGSFMAMAVDAVDDKGESLHERISAVSFSRHLDFGNGLAFFLEVPLPFFCFIFHKILTLDWFHLILYYSIVFFLGGASVSTA